MTDHDFSYALGQDLVERSILLERLYLDPNNPRFIKNSEDNVLVPDQLIGKKQKEILAKFEHTKYSDEEHDVTNIKELFLLWFRDPNH